MKPPALPTGGLPCGQVDPDHQEAVISMHEKEADSIEDSASTLDKLREKAIREGLDTEERLFLGQAALAVKFPNGRTTRPVVVREKDAMPLLDLPLGDIRYVGDFEAIARPSLGTIECLLGSTNSPGFVSLRALSQIPGAVGPEAKAASDPEDVEVEDAPEEARYAWRIAVSNGSMEIEISPSSQVMHALLGRHARQATVKIFGAPCSTHDSALRTLEDYGLGDTF